MRRNVSFLVVAGLLLGCGSLSDGFSTAGKGEVASYAPAGTSTQTVTLRGKILGMRANERIPNFSAAVAGMGGTVGCSPVQDMTYAITLAARPELEDENAFAFHDRWEVILFSDVNNNKVFDVRAVAKDGTDVDVALPTRNYYRMAYKGYGELSRYLFMPYNDLKKGWVLVARFPYTRTVYHQDFTQSYDLVSSFAKL